jgi:hypothetical protein
VKFSVKSVMMRSGIFAILLVVAATEGVLVDNTPKNATLRCDEIRPVGEIKFSYKVNFKT